MNRIETLVILEEPHEEPPSRAQLLASELRTPAEEQKSSEAPATPWFSLWLGRVMGATCCKNPDGS